MPEDEIRGRRRTSLQLLLDKMLREMRRQSHAQIEQSKSVICFYFILNFKYM